MDELNKKLLFLLMEQVQKICKEEGIEYMAEFHLNDTERYYSSNGHMLLDVTTIMTQLQLLEVRKGIKL